MSELSDREFDFFDINGDGQVTTQEVKQFNEKLGEWVTLGEMENILAKFDNNNDSAISFIEYTSGGETDTVDCFGLLSQDPLACDSHHSGEVKFA